ncbi:hypothetical protein DSO57_1016486 [Entomophthora muscae]|uniref:Uncharacterized protein n=1 Tax=Entomophthora muscae TaxID=34485 RepID=A0ACC2TFG0_9FUNG|nr:hypothetical protein DSO57_1016486 [Entomophthora muscae]
MKEIPTAPPLPNAPPTQDFSKLGFVYITVLGLANQVVPHTGSWRPLATALNYLVCIAPIVYMAFQAWPASPVGSSQTLAWAVTELIRYPSSWESKTEEVQIALSKISKDTLICDNQLFKKARNQYLPYIQPSICLLLVLQAHKKTGHRDIAMTYDWLQKNYLWETLCLLILDVIASCCNCQLQQP